MSAQYGVLSPVSAVWGPMSKQDADVDSRRSGQPIVWRESEADIWVLLGEVSR